MKTATKAKTTRKPAATTASGKTWLGMPYQAFAIVPDKEKPETWRLMHHTRMINRAVHGNKIGYEKTVDWELMPNVVRFLSMQGIDGQRVQAEPHEILEAARHLASHYIKAGKHLPDALAVLT